jgi:hypothetical protein
MDKHLEVSMMLTVDFCPVRPVPLPGRNDRFIATANVDKYRNNDRISLGQQRNLTSKQ